MIFEYAIQPDLAASWHDPRAAYPFVSQMGPGQRRVPCAFPAAKWRRLVKDALDRLVDSEDGPTKQRARKNIEVLIQHLRTIGTERKGTVEEAHEWLAAALREHGEFPFGGILVQACATPTPDGVVDASKLEEGANEFWTPPAPSVARRAADLAAALSPLLRCAKDICFVDPFFDAGIAEYRDPMIAYIRAAQSRRDPRALRLAVHFEVRPTQVAELRRIRGANVDELDVASCRFDDCDKYLRPYLAEGVELECFAWATGRAGLKFHNRYVLSNIGSLALLHGLDEDRNRAQTDDITILSDEQHAARRAEFSGAAAVHRLVERRQFRRDATSK